MTELDIMPKMKYQVKYMYMYQVKYFRVISHIYCTLLTIELTNKKHFPKMSCKESVNVYSIGLEQQFMQHTAFFFFYSTLEYEVTLEYLHILAILNISVNNFALDVILCSFWFFKILCPCALIVLYRYFVSVLNLSICSFETNCECMKSAYEQFWERSTLFFLADEFSYSISHFKLTSSYLHWRTMIRA